MSGKRLTILLMLACACPCLADDKEGIHLTGNAGASPSLTLNDGAGFRWDINSNGMINEGANHAYDGAMQLTIMGNNTFSWGSAARVSADGREIELGPYNIGQLTMSRRIYVDPKMGYCRWIDIFENNTGSAATFAVQHYTNTGGMTRRVYSSSGKDTIDEKAWGAVTADNDTASNPAIVHVIASKSSKFKPRFKYNIGDDNLYYNITVSVPAHKAAALCVFQSQCKTFADGKKFLDSFSTTRELTKIPPALRKIILNMASGATTTLGRIKLPRNETRDLAVLRNRDELLGDLAVDQYVVETVFGKLTLDPARVIGLVCPDADDPTVQVALVDGQVVVGKLLSAPLKLNLPNGGQMTLAVDKFSTVSYRLSKDKPDEVPSRGPAVMLRTGQQLFFNKSGGDYAFQSEYGQLVLSPDDLSAIMLDTPDGGLHRAVFRNGSVLAGMLKAPGQKLALDLGMTLTTPTSAIERFVFPDDQADHDKLTEVTLRNEDQLYGTILDESLTIQSKVGKVVAAPREVAEIQFLPESLGLVHVKLRDGTTASGKLMTQNLRFKIQPGPELTLFVGHITSIVNPASDPAASSPATATKPATSPSTKPAATRASDAARAEEMLKAAADEAAKRAKAQAENAK